MRLSEKRNVQRDEVAARQQVIEAVDIRYAELLLRTEVAACVVIEDVHREAVSASRYRKTDPSHANDSERRAVDVLTGEHERRPAAVFPGAKEAFRLAQTACGCKQQRERA